MCRAACSPGCRIRVCATRWSPCTNRRPGTGRWRNWPPWPACRARCSPPGFRDVVGITPGQYLQGWRAGLAQHALRQGRPLKWWPPMRVAAARRRCSAPSRLTAAFPRGTGEKRSYLPRRMRRRGPRAAKTKTARHWAGPGRKTNVREGRGKPVVAFAAVVPSRIVANHRFGNPSSSQSVDPRIRGQNSPGARPIFASDDARGTPWL